MRYLIDYFIRFKRFVGGRIYVLLFLMLIVGLVESIGVTLFLPLLQNGFGDDRLSRALKSVFGFFGLEYSFILVLSFIPVFFTFRALALTVYISYYGKISNNLVVSLRQNILGKIFTADYLYLLKKEIGYINNAVVREIERVVDAFDKLANILKFTLYGIVYAVLAFSILDLRVASVITAVGIIVIPLLKRLNLLTNHLSVEISNLHGKFHSIMIQALSKLKYLKATGGYRKVYEIMDRENKGIGRLKFRLFFWQSMPRNVLELLIIFCVVGLLYYYIVILHRPINEMVFLVLLFLLAARQILNAQTAYRKFLACMGSIEIFKAIENELVNNEEDLKLDGVLADFEKEIVFKDVAMIFPNGKVGLEGVNLTIKPKEMIAFVGHSGSGKSTIANMATGLLKPTSGGIYFGNADYSEINMKDLREKIGYVTQEDVIFNASIRENISLWDENVEGERLKQVIEMAHINNFVENLPKREEELLGDNGFDISGGQRQRLTIARELYKDVKLLILDEATSSLDTKSEKRIYENLKKYKGVKTMLVIAHRLSTVKNADYIYVLDEGRVVEEGRYDELIIKGGEFKRMIEDQRLTATELDAECVN